MHIPRIKPADLAGPIGRLLVGLALFLTSVGCQTQPVATTPASERGGTVFVYLQPMSGAAARLSVRLESISATLEDGEEIPLSLSLSELCGARSNRERLLASSRIPPGQYAGLALRIGSATLQGKADDAALLVPEEVAQVDAPFTVSGKRSVVLSLRFHQRDSIGDRFQFRPVFTAETPPQPPSGLIGLATSRGSDIVTVFDKATGRVAGVIPTGREPAGMAIAPAGTRAYLAVSGEDSLEVIDLLESRIIDRLRLSGGDRPVEPAVTPDGRTLLVVNAGSETVSVVDPAALFELRRIAVGNGPASIVIDALGRRAYVFNTLSDTISILQAPDWEVVATIATDSGPVRGQLNRIGDRLYVIHRTSPYLGVIDPSSLEVLSRVYVGTGATALKVDPRTDRIYLAKRNTGVIDVFEPTSLQLPVDSISTGEEVTYMTIDGDADNLHLVLSDAKKLRIVRLIGKTTVAEIDAGDSPYWVTFPGER